MVEVTPAMAGTNALNVSTLGSLVGTSWVIASYSGELFGEFESITPGYTVNYGSGTNDVVTLMAMAVEELIGDYNNDHVVNAADYTVWRNNLGGDGSLLGANRDPANTGSISQDDYNSWKAHFGETGGAGSLAGSGVVPEPTAAMLALLALAGVAAATRRR